MRFLWINYVDWNLRSVVLSFVFSDRCMAEISDRRSAAVTKTEPAVQTGSTIEYKRKSGGNATSRDLNDVNVLDADAAHSVPVSPHPSIWSPSSMHQSRQFSSRARVAPPCGDIRSAGQSGPGGHSADGRRSCDIMVVTPRTEIGCQIKQNKRWSPRELTSTSRTLQGQILAALALKLLSSNTSLSRMSLSSRSKYLASSWTSDRRLRITLQVATSCNYPGKAIRHIRTTFADDARNKRLYQTVSHAVRGLIRFQAGRQTTRPNLAVVFLTDLHFALVCLSESYNYNWRTKWPLTASLDDRLS